jgi:hypothetical protein
MNIEELKKKALGYIVKHIKDYEKIGQEDYSHLIFDIVREGVAIVNAVILIFESANIDSIVFKKQLAEKYCIDGSAIYNKEKTLLIRVCPGSDIKEFVADCNIAINVKSKGIKEFKL